MAGEDQLKEGIIKAQLIANIVRLCIAEFAVLGMHYGRFVFKRFLICNPSNPFFKKLEHPKEQFHTASLHEQGKLFHKHACFCKLYAEQHCASLQTVSDCTYSLVIKDVVLQNLKYQSFLAHFAEHF